MKRREFITLLGGAAVAPSLHWPLAAHAQQGGRVWRIGLLDYAPFWEPLRQELRARGYVEGQNVVFEYRPAHGERDRLPALASELVRLKVDLIVTFGAVATFAAKDATASIPIVMVGVGDPLGTGLVPNIARPGGNLTGNTILGAEVGAKRLDLLREAVPSISRVAFVWNPQNPANILHFEEVARGAKAMGIALISVPVPTATEFDGALASMLGQRPEALVMTADPMHQAYATQVIEFALQHRLPTMHQLKEHAELGGLMAYGASMPELLRRGAMYVDKILNGVKPGDLPVEQPTKFELVINLKTAKALGLEVPPKLLALADEVIE